MSDEPPAKFDRRIYAKDGITGRTSGGLPGSSRRH